MMSSHVVLPGLALVSCGLVFLIGGAFRTLEHAAQSPMVALSTKTTTSVDDDVEKAPRMEKTEKPPKMCVVTAAYGADYLDYMGQTAPSKRAYAAFHGYTYLEFGSEKAQDLVSDCEPCLVCGDQQTFYVPINDTTKFVTENTTAVKFCAMRRAFIEHSCDWAAWIDADNAFFQTANKSTPLEEIITRGPLDEQQGATANAVFSIDANTIPACYDNGLNHNCENADMFSHCLNDGIFVLRGGDFGLAFVRFVLNYNLSEATEILQTNVGVYAQCHHWGYFDYHDQCAVALYAASNGIDEFRCMLGANWRMLTTNHVVDAFQFFANHIKNFTELDECDTSFVAACTTDPLKSCVNFTMESWYSRNTQAEAK